MNRLHIPQELMANRLGVLQQTISIHLQKMPELAKLVNTDLSKEFAVSQVAEKHGCPEPLMWSIGLEGKSGQTITLPMAYPDYQKRNI